ncbi:MAG TPA: hypothetical protein VF742_04890, partial [Terracidiphilus sp.]
PMDGFEEELSESLVRRPAPPGLKGRILAERARRRVVEQSSWRVIWMRLAASLLIAAVLAGVARWQWQRVEDRRRGEEARQQVLTALSITARALDKVQTRLAAHNGNEE